MGKRTGRKRGAPYGNTNRLVHGRYSAAAIARSRTMSMDLAELRLYEDLAQMLTRMHHLEMRRRREATLS
jgi:hypothetical protein